MTEKEIKKTGEEDEGVLLRLSASRVDCFKQCPRKYYYRYIEKLPTTEQAHLVLGTYVHRVLELFHDRFKRRDGADLRSLMGECSRDAFEEFKKDGKDALLGSEQLQASKEMLSGYIALLENNGMPNVLEVEEKFTVSLNEKYDLVGVVDRIDLDPDGIFHIRDYKTSKSAKYMKPFQLNAYGIHLLNQHPEVKRYRASYIMLKLGVVVPFDFTGEDVENCRNALIHQADTITSEERWIVRPSKLCDWCDFKDVCFGSW